MGDSFQNILTHPASTAMPDSTHALKERLATLRQTAQFLLEKAAVYGSEAVLPPEDRHNLLQTRANIAQCKADLRAQGVIVDDMPEDTATVTVKGGPEPGTSSTANQTGGVNVVAQTIGPIGTIIVQGDKYIYNVLHPPQPSISDLATARVRTLIIQKVREFCNTRLDLSLYGEVQLSLGLHSDPNKFDPPINKFAQEFRGQSENLPENTSIIEVFNRVFGTLLILGEPGSGKTNLLLQIARDLLYRTESDSNQPIPVIFPLSGWSEKDKSLSDWMSEQLCYLYSAEPIIATDLIKRYHILPLLDGLDEIPEKYRACCLQAINAFQKELAPLKLIVCSRNEEYEAIKNVKLHLGTCVIVQSLPEAEIMRALNQLGENLTGLKAALETKNADLLYLSKKPLNLQLLITAYRGKPKDYIISNIGSDKNNLWDIYIDKMLDRRKQVEIEVYDLKVYLFYLATNLKKSGQTVFFIENMQPQIWLDLRGKWLYILLVRWLYPLLFALPIAIFVSINITTVASWYFSALAGIVLGMIFMITSAGIKKGPLKSIYVTKRVGISNKGWKINTSFVRGLVRGVISGVFITVYQLNSVNNLWTHVITTTIMIFIGGMAGFIGGNIVDKGLVEPISEDKDAKKVSGRVKPNIETWNSLKFTIASWVLPSLVGAICGALYAGLSGVAVGVFLGMFLVSANFGGFAFIQHFCMRFALAFYRITPVRFSGFLRFCTERLLLNQIGGGWIFFHHQFLEHCANPDLLSNGHPAKKSVFRRIYDEFKQFKK